MTIGRPRARLFVGILPALLAGLPVIATAGSTSGAIRVYVTNYLANTASVVDSRGHATVATVRVGHAPAGTAVSADRRVVYIANSESTTPTQTITTERGT